MPVVEACALLSDAPLAADDASRAKDLAGFELAIVVADAADSVAETVVRAACDKTPRLRYPSAVSGFPVRAGRWSKR
ncbi:MAG: hypothetical protein WA418_22935 [Bradyrhizobium sp.]